MSKSAKGLSWISGMCRFIFFLVILGLLTVPVFAETRQFNYDIEYNGSNVTCNPGDTLKFGAIGRIKVPAGQTLNLTGCTLDLTGGPNNNRAVLVNGGTLVLENTVIKGAKKEGAVRVVNGGTMTVTGGEFLNNTSVKGGAILIQDKSKLIIDGGTLFQGNKSTFENTNYERSGGGAICAEDSAVTIFDAVFDGNKAVANGGAISHDGGTLVLGNPEAVFNYVSDRDAVRPRFVNNSAGDTARAKGGAIAVEIDCKYNPGTNDQGAMKEACQKSVEKMTLTINHAVFDNNTAVYQGGALAAGYGMKGYWTSNHTTTKETNVLVDIKKAAFTNNKVTNNTGDNVAGGAIVIQTNAKVMMKDAAFVENTASNAGGAIASCLWGANQVSLVEGAAIFDNHAASWTNGHEDVYVMNVTDPDFHPSKFSVRMFNGALHYWAFQNNVEKSNSCNPNDSVCQQVCPGGVCKGVFQGSDPKDKEINGENNKKAFQVLFQGNTAFSNNTGNMVLDRGNGGAIGNNGALNIGGTEDDVTSIALEKIWVNDQDVYQTYRPQPKEFLQDWLKLTRDGHPYALGDITEKQCSDEPAETDGKTLTTCLYDASADPDVMIGLSYESDQEGYTDKWTVSIDGLQKNYYDDATSSVINYAWDVLEEVQKTVSVKVGDGTAEEKFVAYVKIPAPAQDPDTGLFTFTNEFNLISIEGEKTWGQQLANLPSSISVHLHDENNTRIGEPLTVTPDQERKWTWKFEGLPKYRKTSENTYVLIDYWVHEEKINNWDSESDRSKYVMGTDEDPLKYTNYNISNTHNPNGDVSIEVIKAWDDKDDRDGKRENAEFTVALWANDVPYYPDDSGVQLTETLNKGNNWNVKFTGLPEKNAREEPIKYTVTEDTGNTGYTKTDTETLYASDGTTIGYIITNKYEPETVKLSVTKTWEDEENKYKLRPGSADGLSDDQKVQEIKNLLEHIRLFKKVSETAAPIDYRLFNITYVPGSTYQFTAVDRLGKETYTIDVADNGDNTWTLSCSGLPRKENGTDITWLIREDRILHYTPQNVPDEGLSGTCTNESTGRVCTYAVTNELDVTTATLTKTWDDGGHVDTRPEVKTFLESLKLYRIVNNDESTKEALEHGNFTVVQDSGDNNKYTFTISAFPHINGELVKADNDNVWTVTIYRLPKRDADRKEYTWSIEESLAGYHPEIDNTYSDAIALKITNTPVINISVTKIWLDDIDDPEPQISEDGADPEETEGGHPKVTLKLTPGDKTLTLSAEGSWRGVFHDLPKYDGNGDEIIYSVAEAVPDGYQQTLIGNASDGFQIINTALVDIPVRKVWSDDPDYEQDHPEITVSLTADGEVVDGVEPLTLNARSDWQGKFEKQPLYDVDTGEKINYSVQEIDVQSGYDRVSIARDDDGTIVVTNIKNKPHEIEFFRLPELPKTGFSAVRPTALNAQPLSVSYVDSGLTLQVPSLDVKADIVTVPFVDGDYPVEWLGMQAGMLEGSAKPGEGMMVLTGHNTLNSTEAGPFAFLSFMEEGDMIFLLNRYNQLKPYTVYAVEKIGATDSAALERIASMDENSLTMLTCEDELPEGGYASRRVVAAKPVGTW